MSVPTVITSTGYNVSNTDLINYLPVAYGVVSSYTGSNSSNFAIATSKYYNATVTLNQGGGNANTFQINVTDKTNVKGICLLSLGYASSVGSQSVNMTGWSIHWAYSSLGQYNVWITSGGSNPAFGFYAPFSFIIY